MIWLHTVQGVEAHRGIEITVKEHNWMIMKQRSYKNHGYNCKTELTEGTSIQAQR